MRGRGGPSLPQSLLDEINGSSGSSYSWKRGHPVSSRREARKQQRDGKKQNRAQFFSTTNHGPKRLAHQEHEESPQRKKQKLSTGTRESVSGGDGTSRRKPSNDVPKRIDNHGPKQPQNATQTTALERRVASSLKSKNVLPAKTLRTQQEMDEDSYITRLESKLRISRGGKKSKEWDDDGLGDLLNDLDMLEESLFANQSMDEDESALSDGGSEGTGEDSNGDAEELFAESISMSDSGPGSGGSEGDAEEWGGFGSSAEEALTDASINKRTSSNSANHKTAVLPGARYVPPHLRDRDSNHSESSEAQLKLKRQIKGLLNRLSEQNIASITDSIEDLYREHRRHDVTSTITTLVAESVSAHSLLLDSFVVLHAALVCSLHKLIGVEFAAHFVQSAVASYEHHFSASQNSTLPPATFATESGESKGKEASNLLILLSELYNFQVVSCALLYDLIRGLLEGDLSEFKVELLLKITRNSGPQLRSDDPSALKDIIQIVHSKISDQGAGLSTRTRFMIETLTNLKNNKLRKQPGENDTAERLKKFLAGLSKKRQVRAHEPLRITLNDLHTTDSRGKWWLVGAAWGGDPLVEHKENIAEKTKSADGLSENALLKLARKQGMNTDIRRNIFVVLMDGADYVDACERLSQLRLTEIQQREIIRVILHCCGNEKQFNPYYVLVVQQLCRLSKSHQFTLQYCLWDFFRDLGETTVGGAEILRNMNGDEVAFDVKSVSESRVKNIARAYGWWIAKECCSLAILKPVNFTNLRPQSRTFLDQLLAYTLMSSQLSTPLLSSDPKDAPDTHHRGPLEEVFIKATRIPALALGLIHYLGEMDKAQESVNEGIFLKWALKVALDTLKTGAEIVPSL